MNYKVDVAVIGGGASGLVAAICTKRNNPDLSVYIFEGLDRVGKKLITTGNGRCNITNKDVNLSRFHGENPTFAEFALAKYNLDAIRSFFNSVGIEFIFENDKGFPASLQAGSVVDCLRFECDRLGINTVCNCKIEEISFKNGFTFVSENDRIDAKSVICCTGLYSGGEKLGSDGSFFRLLKEAGYKTVKLSPAIVQLKTETELVRQLKGIKIDAKATLMQNGKPTRSEFGEVLFCDYGLSGPAIMNLSRTAARADGGFSVALDLYPLTDTKDLAETIYQRRKTLKDRHLEEFFTGMLNKRLGQIVLKHCGFKLSDSAEILTKNDCEKIALTLKALAFKITGNTGFINSQVTAGGISTDQFDNKTMMSKKHNGLFASGELLDIDGDCGGFNLAWCWASGMLAAEGCTEYLRGLK